jgi:hypothetical protein
MIATVISLAEIRRQSTKHKEGSSDFQTLFEKARNLRLETNESLPNGTIAVSGWQEVRSWFQKEIADEVFKKQLFSRSILTSIWYVADLLTAYAKGNTATVGIVEHVRKYSDQGSTQELLLAANSAFLFFVFWPETRAHRILRYRSFAIAYGPSLFAHYGFATRSQFGAQMSEAFEPLGIIARERFSQF